MPGTPIERHSDAEIENWLTVAQQAADEGDRYVAKLRPWRIVEALTELQQLRRAAALVRPRPEEDVTDADYWAGPEHEMLLGVLEHASGFDRGTIAGQLAEIGRIHLKPSATIAAWIFKTDLVVE